MSSTRSEPLELTTGPVAAAVFVHADPDDDEEEEEKDDEGGEDEEEDEGYSE